MNIATWKQGQGARYSKTLAKISREHKGIQQYYFEDGSHWIILHNGYNCDMGCGTIGEPNVKYALEKIGSIYKEGEEE
tara:strand:- start:6096 stop:6329 length:234 start_codon:yes stop_codon:yes gene_type:complete